MTPDDISRELERIAPSEDFVAHAAALTEEWRSVGVGIEAVRPILRFMEERAHIDFGSPGPLVHFVEQFYGHGYEERLVASINRKPTVHTCSMLNAVINGTKDPYSRKRLIDILRQALWKADPQVRLQIEGYLERLSP